MVSTTSRVKTKENNLNRVHKATGAQVYVQEETETVGVGSIKPGITIRVDNKILNNMKTRMINNMQTYC